MQQRTCNIIMCCKGNSKILLPEDRPLKNISKAQQQVAAYMSRECACLMEDYTGPQLEFVLSEALFDYMDTADKPGAELRNLFVRGYSEELNMSERIMTLFQLVQVRKNKGLVNGFTEELLAQSEKDLAEDGDPVWTADGCSGMRELSAKRELSDTDKKEIANLMAFRHKYKKAKTVNVPSN